jgi:hypothetical protein
MTVEMILFKASVNKVIGKERKEFHFFVSASCYEKAFTKLEELGFDINKLKIIDLVINLEESDTNLKNWEQIFGKE